MGLTVSKETDSKKEQKGTVAPGKFMTLDELKKSVQTTFGKEVVADPENGMDIKRISTGNIEIDAKLGGGIPVGRITEVSGPNESGKTTFTLAVASNAQKMGMNVAFIDAEHALDFAYAQTVGLDVNKTIIVQPDYGEQALQIADLMISNKVGLLIIDSTTALVPKADLEGAIEDSRMGQQAKLMSVALKKLISKINKMGVTVIFINQLRMKIGGYGNPETTTGGEALKYFSSLRLEIRKGEILKDGELIIGQESTLKFVKCKVGRKYPNMNFRIIYGKGIDNDHSLLNLAIDLGVVDKAGAWISMDGVNLAQGVEQMKAKMNEDSKLKAEVSKRVQEKLDAGALFQKQEKKVAKKESKEEKKDKKSKKGKEEKVEVTEEVVAESVA